MLSGDVELHPGPAYKSLNMCHVNIRSLSRSKLKDIELHLAGIYDVITISETYLHLFFHCSKLEQFWFNVCDFISSKFDLNFN